MKTNDYADVAIKPPFLFLAALALGYVLTRYVPIGPGLASPNGLGLTVGLIFVAVGFALAIRAIQMFRRAGTHVAPGQPAAALVTAGLTASRGTPSISASYWFTSACRSC